MFMAECVVHETSRKSGPRDDRNARADGCATATGARISGPRTGSQISGQHARPPSSELDLRAQVGAEAGTFVGADRLRQAGGDVARLAMMPI